MNTKKHRMKKRYQVFIIWETVIPSSCFDTIEEAIESCRNLLFESFFDEEVIIEDLLKDRIIRRFYWQDFNVGGKMYKPELKSESKSKPACPKCGNKKDVVKIIFGFPSEKGMRQAEKGNIKLGGCCIGENDPQWYCKNCLKNFGRLVRRKND